MMHRSDNNGDFAENHFFLWDKVLMCSWYLISNFSVCPYTNHLYTILQPEKNSLNLSLSTTEIVPQMQIILIWIIFSSIYNEQLF